MQWELGVRSTLQYGCPITNKGQTSNQTLEKKYLGAIICSKVENCCEMERMGGVNPAILSAPIVTLHSRPRWRPSHYIPLLWKEQWKELERVKYVDTKITFPIRSKGKDFTKLSPPTESTFALTLFWFLSLHTIVEFKAILISLILLNQQVWAFLTHISFISLSSCSFIYMKKSTQMPLQAAEILRMSIRYSRVVVAISIQALNASDTIKPNAPKSMQITAHQTGYYEKGISSQRSLLGIQH